MGDRRVRQSEEIIPLLGIPLLGRIPDTTTEVRRAYTPYRRLTLKPRAS